MPNSRMRSPWISMMSPNAWMSRAISPPDGDTGSWPEQRPFGAVLVLPPTNVQSLWSNLHQHTVSFPPRTRHSVRLKPPRQGWELQKSASAAAPEGRPRSAIYKNQRPQLHPKVVRDRPFTKISARASLRCPECPPGQHRPSRDRGRASPSGDLALIFVIVR